MEEEEKRNGRDVIKTNIYIYMYRHIFNQPELYNI